MDLQNKYQILATEFSKVRGQVTVLKKAVLDEQAKSQNLQEEINRKDQNLRRNAQEIETLSFLNTQLKSRLEILQHELTKNENSSKSKKTNSLRAGGTNTNSPQDEVLYQELLSKIQQYESMHRRANEFEKQLNEQENDRIAARMTIEQLQNQMAEMQESHQRSREEFERIFKQLKQENDLLNEQVKQHLVEPQNSTSNGPTRKSSLLTSAESSPSTVQAEIFLYKFLTSWRDAFTELTIYIEERLKNNPNSSENNEKMSQTVKAFQQQAENFLFNLKIRLFEGKSDQHNENTTSFAELFSMFISSCEKILGFAIKSICDEPQVETSSENQQNLYERIGKLNENLHEFLRQWSQNICQLREISVAIIQLESSLPNSFDRLQEKIGELLTIFQSGSIIHCDLDKTYNDKLCLEYELNASPVHLTTTDECILAALRKLASLEQQIFQLIRENRTYLFEYQQRKSREEEEKEEKSDENPHQQMIDVHKKQILNNAETIGVLEQEKEHWRLEYQLLKIKFEKMRDDLLKEIDSFKDKTKDEHIDPLSSTGTTIKIDSNDQYEYRRSSDPPSERELMIKQYYSQKIVDLETKLQLANGKGIAFYNELANIHQRLRHSKDQEAKCRSEIDQLIFELTQLKDELATTTKVYEEQIGMMSDHLASLNKQLSSQNEQIDKLQQQLHHNPKDAKKSKK